jgi:hypothetical protein
MTLKCAHLVLLVALCLGFAGAGSLDSLWVSYSNDTEGLFCPYGPQRVMRIHPPDFAIAYPIEIDSLKAEFYDMMGSWTDSIFTFRIYAGDGQTVLYESESLMAPRTLWYTYGLHASVEIDSGDFYVGMTYRSYQAPHAYPFVMTDTRQDTTHCYYGSPGAWTYWDVGEYFFYAWICPCQVGVNALPPVSMSDPRPATIARGGFWLGGAKPGILFDATGRKAADLVPGLNNVSGLAPGSYLLAQPGLAVRKLVVPR